MNVLPIIFSFFDDLGQMSGSLSTNELIVAKTENPLTYFIVCFSICANKFFPLINEEFL